MRRRPLTLAPALLWALSGCPQPGDPSQLGVDDQTPLTVEDTLVYLSESEHEALLVDVSREETRVKRANLPLGRCEARRRPASEEKELVVLCRGQEATAEEDAIPSTLLLLDRDGVGRRYELPGRFAGFELSDDGEWAFVFDARGGIVLATETAFVDLTARPSDDNPRALTVRSLSGESPTGAVFSPPMEVAGSSRRFAVALAPGHVNLFDLGHLERGAITVPLDAAGSSEVLPVQVLFGSRTVYVRAQGLPHILALTLHDARGEGGTHPFAPALSTLALGETIDQALLLEGDSGGELVLALTASSVAIIDVATGTPVQIPTSRGYTDAVRFRGGSPGDDNVRERALLYGRHDRIAFLDLERLEILQGRNLETLTVQADVRGAFPLVAQGRVALQHDDATLLSVVELEDRTVVPVRTEQSLGNALLDSEGAKLWLTTGGVDLASLSLRNLAASEVLLDAPVDALVLLPGEQPRLVAVHDDTSGYVTLLDRDEPTRSTARSLRGFLWEGLLDERTQSP